MGAYGLITRRPLLSLRNGQEKITHIESDIEGHLRLSGGSRSSTPYGPQEVASEKKIEERRKHHLRQYYRKVIQAIADVKKILIFGPGEAKMELKPEARKTKTHQVSSHFSRCDSILSDSQTLL